MFRKGGFPLRVKETQSFPADVDEEHAPSFDIKEFYGFDVEGRLALPFDASDPLLLIHSIVDSSEHFFQQCDANMLSQQISGPDQVQCSTILSNEDEDLLFRVLMGITTDAPESVAMTSSGSPQGTQALENPEDCTTTDIPIEVPETSGFVSSSVENIQKLIIPKTLDNRQENVQQFVRSPPNSKKREVRTDSEDEDDEDEEKNDVDPMKEEGSSLSFTHSSSSARFSSCEDDQWYERFRELKEFKENKGHCLVPCNYPENPALARWVKRQRNQYKQLKADGFDERQENEEQGQWGSSKLIRDRLKALNSIDFVWDRHAMAWEQKFLELKEFRAKFGDCNVPANYRDNPRLAMWIKCQRRQYKKHKNGHKTGMTAKRVEQLERLGFLWELRNGYKKTKLCSSI